MRLLLALVLLCLAVCAVPTNAKVKIVANINSGMDDPVFEADERTAQKVLAEIANLAKGSKLPAAQAKTALSGAKKLGYRGFTVIQDKTVHVVGNGYYTTFKVQGSKATGHTTYKVDTAKAELAALEPTPKKMKDAVAMVKSGRTTGTPNSMLAKSLTLKTPSLAALTDNAKKLSTTLKEFKAKNAQSPAKPELVAKLDNPQQLQPALALLESESKTSARLRARTSHPVPRYDPTGAAGRAWNDPPYANQFCNNCYNFGTNIQNDHFAQPGYRARGRNCNPGVAGDCAAGASADGLINISWALAFLNPRTLCNLVGSLGNGIYCVALYNRADDYHWVRVETTNGAAGNNLNVADKPGSTEAKAYVSTLAAAAPTYVFEALFLNVEGWVRINGRGKHHIYDWCPA